MNQLFSGGIVALMLLAAEAPGAHAQSFREVTEVFEPARAPSGTILGASAVDVNNDGLVDLYRFEQLFLQQPDGRFVDARAEAGLLDEGQVVFGAIFGDYNDDGYLDMFIEDLNPPSFLYRNQRDGTFRRANDETGLDTDFILTQGAAWGDFDNDGLLDLFIGNDDGQNKLFLNQDGQRFANASAGLNFSRYTYGLAAADYDNDGDLDVLIGACFEENADVSRNILLRNDGQGRFTDVSVETGMDDDGPAWGVAWADFNNDGVLEAFVVNMQSTDGRPGYDNLFWNDGTGRFFDIAGDAGIAGPIDLRDLSVSVADYDNDGWQDVLIVGQELRLYRNRGRAAIAFEPVALPDGIDAPAAAAADVNDDGWIDIFLPNRTANRLWINEGGTKHWLKIHTRGTTSNHFGIGARLDLYTTGMRQVREITAGDGMTSQNHALTAHFGLGAAPRVDSLVIRWPSGHVDRLFDFAADQTITVVEGLGLNQAPARFRLLGPTEPVRVADTEVTFTWEVPFDAENDALRYTLYLRGERFSETYENLAAPTLTVPLADLGGLSAEAPLAWHVDATDGYSIRASLDRFTLLAEQGVATEDPPETPASLVLRGSFPNPTRGTTALRFALAQPGLVRATVYDARGRLVRPLHEGPLPAGEHTLRWDAGAAPGLYFFRLETPGGTATQPVVRL